MEIFSFFTDKTFLGQPASSSPFPFIGAHGALAHMAHTARTSCCLLLAYSFFRFRFPFKQGAHSTLVHIMANTALYPAMFYLLKAAFCSVHL